MKSNGQYYCVIHKHRQAFFEQQYPETIRYVEEIRADHLQSMQFVQALLQRDAPAVLQFLLNTNMVAPTPRPSPAAAPPVPGTDEVTCRAVLKNRLFLLRTSPQDHQPPTANRHQPRTANHHPPPTANRQPPPTATAANRQPQPPPTANHCSIMFPWVCLLPAS